MPANSRCTAAAEIYLAEVDYPCPVLHVGALHDHRQWSASSCIQGHRVPFAQFVLRYRRHLQDTMCKEEYI